MDANARRSRCALSNYFAGQGPGSYTYKSLARLAAGVPETFITKKKKKVDK